MMRRTTEQIIDQFFLKLGTLTTVEEAHNTADTKCSVYPVAKTRQHSKWINLPRKKQICIYVNKTDCDTASSKQRNFDEISNTMTNWRDHPQPAEIWWRWLRIMTTESLNSASSRAGV